ncbi:MAG TPA: hypothetical protein VK743_10445 [Steroidobacteraceae bacterium]|nr:hypothetical protein [Steroidobacteraceae bacterium]
MGKTPNRGEFCDGRHGFSRPIAAQQHEKPGGLLRGVAVLAALGHHELVVPETELVPEIRKTGHRLADLAVAFSALFVSLCSLGIALHHGRTMQRLVEANSRPFIQITVSGGHPATEGSASQALSVQISNPGAGAARVERFSILVDDKAVNDMSEALLRLAGLPANTPEASAVLGPMMYSAVAPSYLKAGSDQSVLLWARTARNASIWDKDADAGFNRVKFETCYCSIFDECWIENSHTFRPTPVTSCG